MTTSPVGIAKTASSSGSQDDSPGRRFTPDIDEDGGHDPYGDGPGIVDAIELQSFRGQDEHGEEVDGDHIPWAQRRASTQSFELYTPDEERRVKRKLDVRLTLFVALLYLLSFLDRSNIGNAKVAGMTRELGLSDADFASLLTAFYMSYILFEWMTVLYQIFPPRIYISLCVAAWGIFASLQSLTTTFSALLVLRFLLGIGEAAFVGIPFYLTFFYRREELALRTGLFISAAPLATTFATSLAYAIVGFAQRTQITAWRLLLLLEGFPAIVVAVWCWHWLPDSPSHAWWLSGRERKVAVLRLRSERPKGRARHNFSFAEVVRALRDPKVYLTAAIFFCCNVAFSSMPVFLPTIIESMGHGPRSSQALAAPPFLVAFVVVLAVALISDRTRSRSIPLVCSLLLAMSGYIFLVLAGIFATQWNTLRYLAVFPICAGFFAAVALIITWTVNNQATKEGKGIGMAVLNIIGQCGPLVGTRLYPDSAAPYFTGGMAVCAGVMALAAVITLALRFRLMRENRLSALGARGTFEYML